MSPLLHLLTSKDLSFSSEKFFSPHSDRPTPFSPGALYLCTYWISLVFPSLYDLCDSHALFPPHQMICDHPASIISCSEELKQVRPSPIFFIISSSHLWGQVLR
ncbi:hypothetical protein AVEN_127457-1 [Araneus ventricosus]|uniref:Uncharacterized protein n=1 Tax=Araneus ventricosus TaxID=182803 RepID=A0A4Y2W3H7_ARAVE|nr:hypothetical protein AVEN_49544-1 [Araneus ventricosus]GBO31434.1 hypothetical protein AVEN_127457-1 [Araneus ventricosus]